MNKLIRMRRKDLYKRVLDYFAETLPNPETELRYENPFQLLVAVILSAQCTDRRVNNVTPKLFENFGTPEQMAAATEEQIYERIRTVSYPHTKTKYLIETSKILVEKYGGQVPTTMEQLLELPGVGRKTANVVLAVGFSQPTIAVDTHVFRVVHRIGLVDSTSKTPLQVEKKLALHIPIRQMIKAHHWFLLHGRYVCKAISPLCQQCGIKEICRHYNGQTVYVRKHQYKLKANGNNRIK